MVCLRRVRPIHRAPEALRYFSRFRKNLFEVIAIGRQNTGTGVWTPGKGDENILVSSGLVVPKFWQEYSRSASIRVAL